MPIAKSLEISTDRYWINQAVPGELGRDCGRRLLVLSRLSALLHDLDNCGMSKCDHGLPFVRCESRKSNILGKWGTAVRYRT